MIEVGDIIKLKREAAKKNGLPIEDWIVTRIIKNTETQLM
jgi:hypothetical protein